MPTDLLDYLGRHVPFLALSHSVNRFYRGFYISSTIWWCRRHCFFVSVCVHLSVMFLWYLLYTSMDVHQTFAISASCHECEVVRFWVKRSFKVPVRANMSKLNTRPQWVEAYKSLMLWHKVQLSRLLEDRSAKSANYFEEFTFGGSSLTLKLWKISQLNGIWIPGL